MGRDDAIEEAREYLCSECGFIVSDKDRQNPEIDSECPRCCEAMPDWILMVEVVSENEICRDDAPKNETSLSAHCQKFIKEHHITCADTIYQSERVIENATSFIERVCEIVGYYKIEDGAEEE